MPRRSAREPLDSRTEIHPSRPAPCPKSHSRLFSRQISLSGGFFPVGFSHRSRPHHRKLRLVEVVVMAARSSAPPTARSRDDEEHEEQDDE
jgi:hypothetical protein